MLSIIAAIPSAIFDQSIIMLSVFGFARLSTYACACKYARKPLSGIGGSGASDDEFVVALCAGFFALFDLLDDALN